MSKYKYGWKALGNGGCTYFDGLEFRYNLPRANQRWGNWTHAPNQPETADGQSCGAGGLHLHNKPSFDYAPTCPRLYLARYRSEDILGRDHEKTRVRKCQLLHIPLDKWYQLIRNGKQPNLTGAHLIHANLTGANLRDADLRHANLTGADLSRADLRYADLRYATLSRAHLTDADLRRAILPDGSQWTPDIDMTQFTKEQP